MISEAVDSLLNEGTWLNVYITYVIVSNFIFIPFFFVIKCNVYYSLWLFLLLRYQLLSFIIVLISCTQILHFNGLHSSALWNDSRLWLHHFSIRKSRCLLSPASFDVWSLFNQYPMMISYTFCRLLINFLHIKHYHFISMLGIPTCLPPISWSLWVKSIIIRLSLHHYDIISEINQSLCG
jgi:hypothetical protein